MPQKGFKLVPPSCSGMISFGQLDCPSEKGPCRAEVEGAKRRRLGKCPKAELGSSAPQLAPAGQCCCWLARPS